MIETYNEKFKISASRSAAVSKEGEMEAQRNCMRMMQKAAQKAKAACSNPFFFFSYLNIRVLTIHIHRLY